MADGRAIMKLSFPNKWYYIFFVAGAFFCAGTGSFLMFHTARDFSRFFVLTWHIRVATLTFVLACASMRAYINECGGDDKPRYYFLPTILIQVLPFAQLPWFVSWAVGLTAWLFTSRARFRIPLLIFTVLFNSGLYLVGPPSQTLRTSFFSWNHAIAGALGAVWLFAAYHAAERRRADAGRGVRAVLYATVFILAALVVVAIVSNARRGNARFKLDPVKATKGYAFRITSEATLRKPAVDPAPYLQSSGYCGSKGCHFDVHKQWMVSSHRLAALMPPYRKCLEEFAQRFGWEATSLCSRCHNPLSVLYGVPDKEGNPIADKLRPDGISCQYCHAIAHTNPDLGNGNASGILKPTFLSNLKDEGSGDELMRREFMRFQLLSHRRDFGEAELPADQWCGSCHRAVIPTRFTGGHKLILGDAYTPWKNTFKKHGFTCVDCHMPLTTNLSKVHARSDHRIWGVNQAMARLAPKSLAPEELISNFDVNANLWLQGKLPVPAYELWFLKLIMHPKYKAYKEFHGRPAAVDVGVKAKRSASGNALEIEVKITNMTMSHNFPSSPMDLAETTVSVAASDAAGKIVFSNCGPPGGKGEASEDCIKLGGVPVDAAGKPIIKHHFWDARGVVKKVVLPPYGSKRYTFTAQLPPGVKTPLTVTARCSYRRYVNEINTWVYGPSAPPFPETELSSASVRVK